MNDLISRGKLIAELNDQIKACERAPHDSRIHRWAAGLKAAVVIVNGLDGEDAEPVRHGRWTMNSDKPDTIICSVCDKGFDVWKHEANDFRYCPHCGAEMDAEKEEPQ